MIKILRANNKLRLPEDEPDAPTYIRIRFDDTGLTLAGDAAEKLGERLTRFGTGAAYVSVTAEGSA